MRKPGLAYLRMEEHREGEAHRKAKTSCQIGRYTRIHNLIEKDRALSHRGFIGVVLKTGVNKQGLWEAGCVVQRG